MQERLLEQMTAGAAPDDLAADGRAGGLQVRAAAADGVRRRSGEVDVLQPIGHAVRGPVVAGGAEHGHAEGRGVLEALLERLHGLSGPVALRAAPADREHAGTVGRVMDGGGDRVQKSHVRVGREIDGYASAGRHRPGHLDVQLDLEIRTGRRLARAVLRTVD